MRRQKTQIGLLGLAAMVGLAWGSAPASARVDTERSASIIVFPKVIAELDGSRDTIIQITNTTNSMRHAHCFYVDGSPEDPSLPVGPLNPPRWVETDFDIWLTRQQPTHWVASTGRWVNPEDATCRTASCDPSSSGATDSPCCGAGFDPGRIPPVGPFFTGELKCVEVDASGFPVPGNSFIGTATLVDPQGDVSKYNAIGLRGLPDVNNLDGTLCLGGGASDACPTGAEYEGCPQTWMIDHYAAGATDGPSGATVSPSITVVPCSQNYETQAPATVTLQFAITNEYEQTFSASTSVTCWADLELSQINNVFTENAVGGRILQTRLRSAAGTPGGVMVVLEETFDGGSSVARSAQNVHNSVANQVAQDLIVIPGEQITVP